MYAITLWPVNMCVTNNELFLLFYNEQCTISVTTVLKAISPSWLNSHWLFKSQKKHWQCFKHWYFEPYEIFVLLVCVICLISMLKDREILRPRFFSTWYKNTLYSPNTDISILHWYLSFLWFFVRKWFDERILKFGNHVSRV